MVEEKCEDLELVNELTDSFLVAWHQLGSIPKVRWV